jgi:hypothetical protein
MGSGFQHIKMGLRLNYTFPEKVELPLFLAKNAYTQKLKKTVSAAFL